MYIVYNCTTVFAFQTQKRMTLLSNEDNKEISLSSELSQASTEKVKQRNNKTPTSVYKKWTMPSIPVDSDYLPTFRPQIGLVDNIWL